MKMTTLEVLMINFGNLDKESQLQFVKNLGNLSQLRVLDIYGPLEGVVQSLGNLHKLQNLRLEDSEFSAKATTREWDKLVLSRHLRHLDLSDISFSRLPSCIKLERLLHLYKLFLQMDYLDEAGLRVLGRLPELRFLDLRWTLESLAFTATVANITAGDDFFPNLRCFELGSCMIQLVVNEDSTSVSFSIWGGKGNMAFVGSKAEDESSRLVAPPPVVPNLKKLGFFVPVGALYKDGNGGCENLRLECLPSLRNVQVRIVCYWATPDEVEKAEAELRVAAQLDPKGPMLELKRLGEMHMDDSDELSAEESEGELVSSSGD
ncbi:unnamed protein product [Urochloa humidicola]